MKHTVENTNAARHNTGETMEFKYIIIDRIRPVLFAHGIEHIDEANKRNVTSAGFVQIMVTPAGGLSVRCFGRSESLNIDSEPARDSNIITRIAANSMGLGAM